MEMAPHVGWSFKCLSRGIRRHTCNRSLSRGEGNNIEAYLGGWNKTEASPGDIYKSVPGRWRYNISFNIGGADATASTANAVALFMNTPAHILLIQGCFYILSGGGGGGGGGGGYVCNYCYLYG